VETSNACRKSLNLFQIGGAGISNETCCRKLKRGKGGRGSKPGGSRTRKSRGFEKVLQEAFRNINQRTAKEQVGESTKNTGSMKSRGNSMKKKCAAKQGVDGGIES